MLPIIILSYLSMLLCHLARLNSHDLDPSDFPYRTKNKWEKEGEMNSNMDARKSIGKS